jgi:cbb3-type cytochrome oxidase subunit 3
MEVNIIVFIVTALFILVFIAFLLIIYVKAVRTIMNNAIAINTRIFTYIILLDS